jgi:hypothetical protein
MLRVDLLIRSIVYRNVTWRMVTHSHYPSEVATTLYARIPLDAVVNASLYHSLRNTSVSRHVLPHLLIWLQAESGHASIISTRSLCFCTQILLVNSWQTSQLRSSLYCMVLWENFACRARESWAWVVMNTAVL